jgi:hypothetical protein
MHISLLVPVKRLSHGSDIESIAYAMLHTRLAVLFIVPPLPVLLGESRFQCP